VVNDCKEFLDGLYLCPPRYQYESTALRKFILL